MAPESFIPVLSVKSETTVSISDCAMRYTWVWLGGLGKNHGGDPLGVGASH